MKRLLLALITLIAFLPAGFARAAGARHSAAVGHHVRQERISAHRIAKAQKHAKKGKKKKKGSRKKQRKAQ